MVITQISNILATSINRAGVGRQLKATLVCQAFRSALKKKNKKAADKCQPLYLRNKILYVKCPTSSWAQEIQMMAYDLIEEINMKFKKTVIERLQFKL